VFYNLLFNYNDQYIIFSTFLYLHTNYYSLNLKQLFEVLRIIIDNNKTNSNAEKCGEIKRQKLNDEANSCHNIQRMRKRSY